jgi:DNA-binding response OmpR family regulator
MDGFETMRMVRQQRPLIPIVVISGRPVSSAPDFLTMATKLGAVSSLQKPFKPADLLASVAGCLETAQRPSSQAKSRQFIQAISGILESTAGAAGVDEAGQRVPADHGDLLLERAYVGVQGSELRPRMAAHPVRRLHRLKRFDGDT